MARVTNAMPNARGAGVPNTLRHSAFFWDGFISMSRPILPSSSITRCWMVRRGNTHSPFKQLSAPGRDLVCVNVKLLR